MVWSGDGKQVLLANEVLTQSTRKDPRSGLLQLVTKNADGAADTVELFAEALGQLDFMDVRVKVVGTSASSTLPIAVRRAPIEGAICSWNLNVLHTELGLTQRADRRNTWVQDRFEAWKARLANTGLQSHLLRSTPYGQRGSGAFGDRVTHWPSVTTPALLTMMCWWAFADKNGGGFGDTCNRDRASICLEALCDHALSKMTVFRVYLGELSYRWPRPPTGTWPVVLRVRESTVDITELRAKYAKMGQYGSVRKEKLEAEWPGREQVDVIRFLRFCVRQSLLFLSLGGQLVRAIALALDAGIVSCYQCGETVVGRTLSLDWEALSQSTDYALENLLYRYWWAYRSFVKLCEPLRWSMAVDKSRVYGVALQLGVLALGNVAWWAPPQDTELVTHGLPRGF